MGQVLFIVWRESVEALLVVGILHAWLSNGGAATRRGLPYLWAGVGLGVIAACGLGAALLGFSEILSGDAQDYYQIAMVLLAAALIVQMVYWMRKNGRTMKRDMESSLKTNLKTANWWGVLALAALAIAREGSETVLFLYGLNSGEAISTQTLLIGSLIGFGLAVLTFYLLQLGGKIFSWRRFFQVTEIMLLLLAAGLLMSGLDHLISLDIIPALVDPMWNTAWLLDDSATFGNLVSVLTGYRAHPALMSLLVYIGYWVLVSVFLKRTTPKNITAAKLAT
ncbi:FTR1 family iron permease [Glaciimonas immobilis]|uniref:High-affinity iron transporter n=1 Tax=Glaciimonas immobilis TaxID=728004 RepID=A0A840RPK7_9BURK|nr:FTR1 family protein [Glaciimonas immobilis]KAF3999016.1 FTR1 family iron permease [Glaciimonas immobilis]MBB5198439.1 high-affinity iron transporter [Glaciimonas immobilis]